MSKQENSKLLSVAVEPYNSHSNFFNKMKATKKVLLLEVNICHPSRSKRM